MDREKVISDFERWCDEMADECPVICHHALALLKEQEAEDEPTFDDWTKGEGR